MQSKLTAFQERASIKRKAWWDGFSFGFGCGMLIWVLGVSLIIWIGK